MHSTRESNNFGDGYLSTYDGYINPEKDDEMANMAIRGLNPY